MKPARKILICWYLMAGLVAAAGLNWSNDAAGPKAIASPGLKLSAAPRSYAVYPKQELPLKFSHQKHLAKGMSCTSCHVGAEQSTQASTRLLPGGKHCDSCHGASHPPPPPVKGQPKQPRKCGMCHELNARGLVAKSVVAPPARLRFSHKAHQKTACARCHSNLAKVDLATRDHLPTEASCLECHDGKKQSNACQLCHPQSGSGKLSIRADRPAGMAPLMPSGSRRGPMAHDLRFVFDHANIARAQRDQCMSCHVEQFCSDCHGNGMRPLQLHPAGFLGTHGMDASTNTRACMSCHQQATDCRACHLRFGISDGRTLGQGPGPSTGPRLAFHPPGYASAAGISPHASDARRNISACASCHSEDSCLGCHATQGASLPGLGATPHGSSFVSSGRCSALRANRRMCLKCHAPGSMALECRETSGALRVQPLLRTR